MRNSLRRSNISASLFTDLISLFLLIVFGIGWVANIITMFNHANEPFTPMFVLRGVGIFVGPLGAILGYL
jgi:hypothetical protein